MVYLGILNLLTPNAVCFSSQQAAVSFGYGEQMAMTILTMYIIAMVFNFLNLKIFIKWPFKRRMIIASIAGTLNLCCYITASLFCEYEKPKSFNNNIGFCLIILGCIFSGISWSLSMDSTLGYCKFLPEENSAKFLVGIGMGYLFWSFVYLGLSFAKLPMITFFILALLLPVTRIFLFYYVDTKAELGHWKNNRDNRVQKALV